VRVFANIPGRPPACDRFLRRLVTLAREQYTAATRELLDGPFAVARLQARVDGLHNLIAGAVAEDPNGPSMAAWEASVEKLRADLVPMRSYIEQKLGP
jgi:hypothetical protein